MLMQWAHDAASSLGSAALLALHQRRDAGANAFVNVGSEIEQKPLGFEEAMGQKQIWREIRFSHKGILWSARSIQVII